MIFMLEEVHIHTFLLEIYIWNGSFGLNICAPSTWPDNAKLTFSMWHYQFIIKGIVIGDCLLFPILSILAHINLLIITRLVDINTHWKFYFTFT